MKVGITLDKQLVEVNNLMLEINLDVFNSCETWSKKALPFTQITLWCLNEV